MMIKLRINHLSPPLNTTKITKNVSDSKNYELYAQPAGYALGGTMQQLPINKATFPKSQKRTTVRDSVIQ
jgi:hypothetical protein